MNAPALQPRTVPEFLAWAESQDKGRYELFRGGIVAMAPERAAHARAKQRAANALAAAIERSGVLCEAFVDSLAITIDDETAYVPDALVDCGPPIAPDSVIAPSPVIVVEVLSRSRVKIDKTVKLADYFRVPTLAHYVIVDLDRRRVLHHRRQLGEPITLTIRTDGDIAFDPPGISVAVASFLD